MTIRTHHDADALPPDWPACNVDREQAEANADKYRQPRNNSLTRHTQAPPPLGTWRLDWTGRYGEFSVLVEIPVSAMQPSEGDWEHALRLSSTRQYIEWQREGHMPPPIDVITTKEGSLRAMNRRRWLAAREAGTETLLCWYSPSADGRGVPKWEIVKG